MSSWIRDLAGGSAAMEEVFGDAALIRHALAFEAALAAAKASAGLITAEDADKIADACASLVLDPQSLAQEAAHAGTLAIPLVAHLRRAIVDEALAGRVHFGATSQDMADTAMILQARDGVVLIQETVEHVATSLAALAGRHAAAPMLGRTLLQSALPTTFGLTAAGWLTGIEEAAGRLTRESEHALMLQLGGAAGTRAGLAGKGSEVAAHMAAALRLSAPLLPWHARRGGVAGLASALAIMTGAAAKIARDISLLSQDAIGEVFEPRQPGRGGSSAMAHKRNATGCQIALSAGLRVPHLAATILSAMPQELERGIGGWQAEGPALADIFILCQGALEALAPVIAGLEVDAARMRANLAAANVGSDTGEAEAMVKAALAGRSGR